MTYIVLRAPRPACPDAARGAASLTQEALFMDKIILKKGVVRVNSGIKHGNGNAFACISQVMSYIGLNQAGALHKRSLYGPVLNDHGNIRVCLQFLQGSPADCARHPRDVIQFMYDPDLSAHLIR